MDNRRLNHPTPEECLDLTINEDQDIPHNELTLVGRLLTTKHINYKAITAVLTNAWNLGKKVAIKSLEQNTISCTFTNTHDMNKILAAGPWSVKGATLNLIN